jgi:outer membrane protein assembly factor BamB
MSRLATALASLLLTCLFWNAALAQNHDVPPTSLNVLTYHNDNQRTGLNPLETTLTPANVNVNSFGKVDFLTTNDRVRTQALYVSGLTINGQVHNVVYVADDGDNVYAFDADSGDLLWQRNVLKPLETTAPFSRTCPNAGNPGIVGTPVIDRNAGPHGAIYFVAASYGGSMPNYHHRLHALDLTSGAELFGGPTEIRAQYPGEGDNSSNGYVVFDPGKYFVRAALVQSKGSIVFGFASLCDQRPYTGWVMQYSASNLQQLSALNLTPNGNSGAIWQSGGGIAADSDGYLYLLNGNGSFDTVLNIQGYPQFGDFGNTMVKISGTGLLPMKVVDYFAMYNTVQESDDDSDLGSSAPMVVDVPSGQGTVHLVIGAGKDGDIYVADRNNMGKWNPLNNNNIYQDYVKAMRTGNFGMPAFFNNTVYYGALYAAIRAFPFVEGKLQPPISQTAITFTYPGTTPSISSNLSSNAILWAVQNGRGSDNSVLYAYDALDLTHELYDSNQNPDRDQFGTGNKFVTPMIANGKVYIATQTGVAVFGLLNQNARPASHR